MIFLTGAAGFIGFHVAQKLLSLGKKVVAIDNINEYYDPVLKRARLEQLQKNPFFEFHKIDLCDYESLKNIFTKQKISKVCHLAAQAGVRYSLTHPFAYQKSNNEGFLNIIELSRHSHIENFVYASSSSVYGKNSKMPFSETDPVDQPISLYAATKRSNELTAYSYSHLFGLPTSGLRFFTVYGPWGRPDMALFLFTKAISENKPITVFNYGNLKRNFTYIDDIVDGILRILDTPRLHELYNIGNSRAENLSDFITAIEDYLGKRAIREYLPMQLGDVKETVADITKIKSLGYNPCTNIDVGIKNFVAWYKEYFNINFKGISNEKV